MKRILILFLTIVTAFGLAGCAKKVPTKDDFIKASVELQCFIVQKNNNITTQEEALNKVKNVFAKYGFPVDDSEAMNKMVDEFNKDQPTLDAISAETEKCIPKS